MMMEKQIRSRRIKEKKKKENIENLYREPEEENPVVKSIDNLNTCLCDLFRKRYDFIDCIGPSCLAFAAS
jgi:hypothetical protein